MMRRANVYLSVKLGVGRRNPFCVDNEDGFRRSHRSALNYNRYGACRIFGFPGCIGGHERDALPLDPERVSAVHEQAGTILGTSRGPEDPSEIVKNLIRLGLNIFFVIGGDGD